MTQVATPPQTLKPSAEGEGWKARPIRLKIIDYALVSGFTSREPWKPAPKVARTRKELIDNAGSEYTPGGQIGGMAEIAVPNRSVVNFQEERLALVGLPCELQGFWRMNTHWIAAPKLGRNLVFTIGLFCSKVFDYQKMMVDYVQAARGIDLSTVTKVNIKKNHRHHGLSLTFSTSATFSRIIRPIMRP